ncbi:phage portal protein [Halalkalibacterium halodurans]|uniref:phage portal protein n=1 Tax=Halalkalibacterium halodurans TaxID=86665 RepID=UPI002E202882|nr:phage portal protein [Halalkalibacterium halodurans]MED4126318.1 phage portal protein [Halalkalibacterium halodurans]
MTKTKAYVLQDGTVVSEKYLDQYAIKNGESKQIPEDHFKDSYQTDGLVQPLYNPEALAKLLEMNTHHYRAVKTKAGDVAGLGWKLKPKEGIEKPSEAQKQIAIEFLNNVNPRKTLNEINVQVMIDFESIGYAFYEVIRSGDGDKEIIGLEHIPSHTMRIHRDMNRFCQIRGKKKAWFVRYGIEKDVHVQTGEYHDKGSLEHEERANEVLYLMNYTSRSDYYGVPDVMPALGALLGERERQEYNISFFDNHAVPAYAVTVTGAELDDETEKKIQKFFQQDVKNSRHSTLVLTASRGDDDYSTEPIKFEFHALSTDMKEASFRMFRQDNRDEILSAHGVPPYRAGITIEGQLGGSVADETTEIYKQSIINPKEEMIENIINRYILQDGLEITDWVFELNEIDTRDIDKELNRLKLGFDMGAYSPNMILERLGENRIDDPNMDRHYINGHPIDGITQNEMNAVVQSVKELHETISSIVKKGWGSYGQHGS